MRNGPIMPASLKTCKEPNKDATARMGGLDCWKPCAPVIGENTGGMSKRVESSCPHQPANLKTVGKELSTNLGKGSFKLRPWPLNLIPLFVHVQPSNAAWSRIEVLVCTPNCKIGFPVMQRKRHVANRMSQVPTANTSLSAIHQQAN